MSKWPLVPLSQIAVQGQYGLNAPAMKEGSGVRFIRITDIDDQGNLKDMEAAYVPRSTAALDKYLLAPGDLLIARSGATAGKSFLFKELAEPAVFAGYLIRFRVHQAVALPSFLAAFFKSNAYWEYINTTKRAVAQPNINAQELGAIPIPLPPLDEQRRIVDLVSRAEGIVRLQREAQKRARAIVPALFVEMFGDPTTNPKGWPSSPLHAVAEVISGVAKGRDLAATEVVELPYMRVANVKDGHLDLSEVKTIEIKRSEVAKLLIEPGDLLMTEGGDPDKLGRAALWHGEIDRCVHQNHIFKVRSDRSKLAPEYLRSIVGSAYGKAYFLSVAKQTTGIASINKTQLSAFPVLVPPLDKQQAFVVRAAAMESIQKLQDFGYAKAEAAFKALLSRVFSRGADGQSDVEATSAAALVAVA